MKLVHKADLSRNDKQRTSFARKTATAESRSGYCDWRAWEAFRDHTPAQIEARRHLSPHRQLKFGRKRGVGNWITAS